MKYCVYLTIYRGNKLPPFYIGFSTVLNISKGYRGTVVSMRYKNIWIKEVKDNPNMFKTIIIRKFDTAREAKLLETKLQRLVSAHKNSLYVNQAINGEQFYGGEKTLAHREKISKTLSGRTLSEEHIANISVGNKGKRKSDIHKDKIRQLRTGIPRTEETKNKLRGRKHAPEAIEKMRLAKVGKTRGPYKKKDQLS